ncbi:MAG: tetratricopeptide repeat protein [Alphaproteobacteria bacterium]|nr:tetratricopeptide repeat protein [Alphaproteobacteria bacterium]
MQFQVSFSNDPILRKALGFLQSNRFIEALDACNEALAGAPKHAELHYLKGIIVSKSGNNVPAAEHLEQAIKLSPNNSQYYAVLGSVCVAAKRYIKAAAAYREAITRDPGNVNYIHELLNLLFLDGDLKAYLQVCEDAMKRFPDDPLLALSYKNVLPYDDRLSAVEQAPIHRSISARFLGGPPVPQPPRGQAKSVLTIGYFAPYLHVNFMRAFLKHHDPKKVKAIVYTNDLRICVCSDGAVRPLSANPMQNLEAIRRDGVDILIDMVGPIPQMYGMYKIFSHRVAPIQLSWFATTATSGTSYIDGVLADEVIAPPEDQKLFTEKLLHLSQCYLPFSPHGYEPEVCVTPPAEKNGYITFGSANKVLKCSDSNFALWRDLLKAVPESRLHWQEEAFSDPDTAERWLARFEEGGIERKRLNFTAFVWHPQFYAFYDAIDISLDTTPYNGGITTFESMWMGVPPVILAGDRFISRTGKSMLKHFPQYKWVAETPEEYIAIAKKLASDVPALARLRKELRPAVQASPLCDGAAFAKTLEETFHKLWNEGAKAAA